MSTIIKTISRRQFFGRAAVGAVGIVAVPFMLWEALAKPVAARTLPAWGRIPEGYFYKGQEWITVSSTRRIMSVPLEWWRKNYGKLEIVNYRETRALEKAWYEDVW